MTEQKEPGAGKASETEEPQVDSTDATSEDTSTVAVAPADDDAADRGWREFPKQVEAALEYARSNTYDYGPRLRKLELEHTVVSAQVMSERITRVVLEYQPTTKFRGQSGSEFLDVDETGVIQARRQIRVPKETMPWLLVGVAALSVIAAVVLVPLIFLTNETGDNTFVAGRTLFVKSEQPRVGSYFTYVGNDIQGTPRTWIIIPEGEETSIAYVELTIFNESSALVSMSIDTDAAQITTTDGITVSPVNIATRALWPEEGAELDPRLEVFNLPLWGDSVLETSTSLNGFLAFEVPRGSEIASLRWSATDVANIRY